jgi:RNA polymerase sigma-70 factor (ECF subfamily)
MHMADGGYPRRTHEPPAAEVPDADLVSRAKRGDRAAFGRLVRRHQARVFALGVRWLSNADDADDLVQETFVRAWQALGGFDETRAFLPWLMTIAANRARTKASARRPAEEPDESLVWEGASPADETEGALLARDVGAAVDGLPEEQRVVLHLRAVDGLSYREIAQALDVPVGTVMSRLARAREALRARLAARGYAPEGESP